MRDSNDAETTMAAAFLPDGVVVDAQQQHYDPTPVTRNTSQPYEYVDASTPSTSVDDGYNIGTIVTPPPEANPAGILQEGILREECSDVPEVIWTLQTTKQGSLDLDLTGPSMPKLRSAQRANSAGHLDPPHTIRKALAATMGDYELLQDEFPFAVQDPVPFSLYRKFESFPNRQQYEYDLAMQQQQLEDDDIYSTQGLHVGDLDLEPYQPSRSEDLGGVGTMPEEVLGGIFIARRQRSTNVGDGSLTTPIPMNDERQWSIPSIHMAHPLLETDSSATTSYTENTEDDELWLFGRGDDYDNASLSSHCSSLYLPDNEVVTAGEPIHLDSTLASMVSHQSPIPRHILQPQVVMNPQVRMSEYTVTGQKDLSKVNDDDADLSRNAVYDYGDRSLAVDRRRRKQRKREERAFEWLQSVQGNKHVLAEAASSKFLTTGNGNRRRRPAAGAEIENNELPAASGVLEQPQVPVTLRNAATPAMLLRQALTLSVMASKNVATNST
jgi:hypothetical protein